MAEFVDKYMFPAWNQLTKDLVAYGIISILASVIFGILAAAGAIALILGIGGGIIAALMAGNAEAIAATGFSLGALIGGVIMAIFFAIGGAFCYGILVRTALDSPKVPAAGEAFSYGSKYILSLIILGIVLTIVLGIAYALLIIPGIILSILFALSPVVLIAGNTGPIEAMRRSYNIVLKDVWGLVLSCIVFAIVIGILTAIPVVGWIANILSPMYSMLLAVTFYRVNSK